MYKHSYTAKIGFTKVLDRTCSKCGGMYSSNEKTVCPKCNAQLAMPTYKDKTGVHPYLFTEVTLYPLMRQADREDFEARTKKANNLGHLEIKMILWCREDKEKGTVYPDARTQYLVPKRTVRVEFNTPPQIRPFTSQKHGGQQRVELKYNLNSNRGDELEFLDDKQEAQTMNNEATAALNARAAETQQATGTSANAATAAPAIDANAFQEAMGQLMTLAASLQGTAPAPAGNAATGTVGSPVPGDTTPTSPPADLDPDDGGVVSDGMEMSPFPAS